MEYRTALFFLFLYYIRPQDWIPSIAGFNIVRPMILIWVASLFAARDRPVVSGALKTPHDWALLAYFGYIAWNAPEGSGATMGLLPYLVFYAFTVRSLSSWERVQGYLKFWNLMLLCVAGMAISSLYGFDPTGAGDITAALQGRLSLGTWLHNNPNALAHSVVVAIPLSYILYFWSKGAGNRLFLFPAFAALAGYCVYETKSKGAFLVGGILVVLLFVIGRPRFVQVLALAMAATVGISALSFLPRMEKMNDLGSDEGVQGRLMVWEMARRVTHNKPGGEGWKQFHGMITWKGEVEAKATHSSYVQVGGDLGINGLFLYLFPLWLSMRSLLSGAKRMQEDPEKERCRRAVMLLLIAYAISGWMINREYHTEYFLLVAVAAAIHRLNLADELEPAAAEDPETDAESAPLPALSGQPALALAAGTDTAERPYQPRTMTFIYETGKQLWNRITVVDVGVGIAMTWAVLFTWDYVLEKL